MNKNAVYNLVGFKAGTKLINWLDPCCDLFCTDIKTCLGISADSDPRVVLNKRGDWIAAGTGGSPSMPLKSIQYNNAGSFGSDGNFTRDPSTSNTKILKDFSGTIQGGFELSDDILSAGLASGTALTWTDSSTSKISLIIAGDTSASGGNPASCLMASVDGNTSDRAVIEATYSLLAPGMTAVVSAYNGPVVTFAGANVDSAAFGYGDGSLLYQSKISINGFEMFDPIASEYYLKFNIGTKLYEIGNVTSGTKLSIDDNSAIISAITQSTFQVKNNAGDQSLLVDSVNFNVAIGNVSSIGGTKIIVDDITQRITVTNVPNFADDAAAAGGGLTTGQLYKTTTGGSTFLKIVP